jgi:hypothetical protein
MKNTKHLVTTPQDAMAIFKGVEGEDLRDML